MFARISCNSKTTCQLWAIRVLCLSALGVATLSCTVIDQPETIVRIRGRLKAPAAIANAEVVAYAVDRDSGMIGAALRVSTRPTDLDGNFEMEFIETASLVLLIGRGGTTREYWEESNRSLDTRGHFSAVIDLSDFALVGDDGVREVSITPFTSLLHTMAEARLSRGLSPDFVTALRRSQRLLHDHLLGPAVINDVCEANLTCLKIGDAHRPHDYSAASIHGVVLSGYSAVAYTYTQADGQTYVDRDTLWLTRRLIEDLEDSFLDGEPYGDTTPETLRAVLATETVTGFLRSMENHTGLAPNDLAGHLKDLAERDMPEIFGPNPPERWIMPVKAQHSLDQE